MREKVLIIGGTGFIGSHILKTFSNKNYKLFSLSKKKIANFKKIKNVKYIFSDVSKFNQLKNISEKNFDHVVNLCGYIDHKNKKENNSCHFEGSKNAAKVFNSHKLKTFIQVGSSLEYGRQKSPQKEKRLCKPIGVYGISKYKASKFLQNFKKSNHTDTHTYPALNSCCFVLGFIPASVLGKTMPSYSMVTPEGPCHSSSAAVG